jgi:hypothetical protein
VLEISIKCKKANYGNKERNRNICPDHIREIAKYKNIGFVFKWHPVDKMKMVFSYNIIQERQADYEKR